MDVIFLVLLAITLFVRFLLSRVDREIAEALDKRENTITNPRTFQQRVLAMAGSRLAPRELRTKQNNLRAIFSLGGFLAGLTFVITMLNWLVVPDHANTETVDRYRWEFHETAKIHESKGSTVSYYFESPEGILNPSVVQGEPKGVVYIYKGTNYSSPIFRNYLVNSEVYYYTAQEEDYLLLLNRDKVERKEQ